MKTLIVPYYVTPNPNVLLAKSGTFTEPGATGNQSVSGLGFTPKLILFFYNRATSDGTPNIAEMGFGVGISSSNRRAIDFQSDDNLTTSANGIVNQNALCIKFFGSASAADFVSLDSDGFTVNWTIVSGASYLINYLAIGGTAFTNAFAGTLAAKTSTGNQAYTGVGFQPDAMMYFAGKWATEPTNVGGQGGFLFGAASSSSARGWVGERSKNVANPQRAFHRHSTTHVAGSLGDSSVANEADLVSFDSDGFTLNFTTAIGTADSLYYLALKGGNYKVGNLTQPGTTGNQTISGLGFTPKALILFSANDTTANADSTLADGQISLGWATGASERGCMWAGDKDNVSPTQTDKSLDRTKVIKLYSPGTPTLNAAADLDSFTSDGFVLNWTTVDATARQIIYLAIG